MEQAHRSRVRRSPPNRPSRPPALSTTMRAFLTGAGIFMVSASVVGVLWYGAQDVMSGHHDAGPALAIRPLRGVRRKLPRPALGGLRRIRAGGRRGRAAGRNPRRRARHPGAASPKPLPEPSPGTVSFEDVHFSYPTRAEQRPSMASASPWPPASGSPWSAPRAPARAPSCNCCCGSTIRRRARSWSMACRSRGRSLALRARMALVPQEPTIFGASVRDNIRYGRHDATDEDIAPRRRRWRPPTASSGPCRRATTPSSASAA